MFRTEENDLAARPGSSLLRRYFARRARTPAGWVAGRMTHAGNLEGQVVSKAVEPILARFVGLDDVVRLVVRVLSGVLIGAGIATADVAAGSAAAQVYPPSVMCHALYTAGTRGIDLFDFADVLASLAHDHSIRGVGRCDTQKRWLVWLARANQVWIPAGQLGASCVG